jgi:hypothetical protein
MESIFYVIVIWLMIAGALCLGNEVECVRLEQIEIEEQKIEYRDRQIEKIIQLLEKGGKNEL